ncbi:hypothetical protein [Clostridium sp. Marseille-Q7071]
MRIENGQLTIKVEISFNQTNFFNRLFNESDCVTFKIDEFKTSLLKDKYPQLSIVNYVG